LVASFGILDFAEICVSYVSSLFYANSLNCDIIKFVLYVSGFAVSLEVRCLEVSLEVFLKKLPVKLTGSANCRLLFQTIEKNTEAELERLTRNSKQMTDHLQATHAADLRAVDKRLKTDEVI